MPIGGDWYISNSSWTTTGTGGDMTISSQPVYTSSTGNVIIGTNTTSDTWAPITFTITPVYAPTYTISTIDITNAQPMTAPSSLVFYTNTGYSEWDDKVKKMQDHIKRAAVPKGCQLSFDF